MAKLGGRVLDRIANRRVVYLPFAAAKQLQRHEAVASMQRETGGRATLTTRYTPTRADPLHRTVELPKPVTNKVAKAFNWLFKKVL